MECPDQIAPLSRVLSEWAQELKGVIPGWKGKDWQEPMIFSSWRTNQLVKGEGDTVRKSWTYQAHRPGTGHHQEVGVRNPQQNEAKETSRTLTCWLGVLSSPACLFSISFSYNCSFPKRYYIAGGGGGHPGHFVCNSAFLYPKICPHMANGRAHWPHSGQSHW